jgi:hypothetical protein
MSELALLPSAEEALENAARRVQKLLAFGADLQAWRGKGAALQARQVALERESEAWLLEGTRLAEAAIVSQAECYAAAAELKVMEDFIALKEASCKKH